jgi:hypothetical protein
MLIMQADFGGAGVGVEAFQGGEFEDGFQGLFEGWFLVFDDAGAALELVHGQAGE